MTEIRPKVPNIPFLNIGFHNLNLNEGKLIFQNGEKHEIYDVTIKINKIIEVFFKIKNTNTQRTLYEMLRSDQIEYFDLKFLYEDYKIFIKDFHLNNNNFSLNADGIENIFSGLGKKSTFTKNIFDESEKVNVWTLIENISVSQNIIKDFTSLNNFYLKSKYTHDPTFSEVHKLICGENERCDDFEEGICIFNCDKAGQLTEKIINQQNMRRDSFNQFKDVEGYFFYDDYYSEIRNKWDKIIDDLFVLLSFYSSKIVHQRICIIKQNDFLEIRIEPSNYTNLNGDCIFSENACDLYEFIESSYPNYHDLDCCDFDIRLLIHYFVWIKNQFYTETKILLGSTFIEALKAQYYGVEWAELFKKLDRIYNSEEVNSRNALNIDTEKIFKHFQYKIFKLFNEIESQHIDNFHGDEKYKVRMIFEDFRKKFFLHTVVYYRNKIVHRGNITAERDDLIEILDEVKNLLDREYNGLRNTLLHNLYENYLKPEFQNNSVDWDDIDQSILLERLIELTLLELLKVDCLLANYPKFHINKTNEYINLFK